MDTPKIDEYVECNICLQRVDIRHCTSTICGHYYHKNCLCNWFNSRLHLPPTCPTCRGDLRYEKGVVKYYDYDRLQLKSIQNTDGEYFFYPDRNRKYFLEIDRVTERITGGTLYNRNNTQNKVITPDMLERYRDKFERLMVDENYEIFGEV